MCLCDVSGGDGEDVWVRELIQDVQLVSCIVLPNLQRDELSCIRLLSGVVKALVDSAILTPRGGREGGREEGKEGGMEGREGGREGRREGGREGQKEGGMEGRLLKATLHTVGSHMKVT